MVTAPDPKRRRNNVVRVIGGSEILTFGCASASCDVPTASVTRPAKSEILVRIEVSSVRPDECGVRRSLSRSRVSSVSVLVRRRTSR